MRTSPLFVGLLVLLSVAFIIPMTVEAPPKVNSVIAQTDRTDYIVGMVVNATATVEYGGQIPALPSTEIWFEWFYPNGTMFLNESMDFVDPDSDHNGTAYSLWNSNYSGPSGLPFWVNVTYPYDPTIKNQTQFFLYYPDEHFIVTDMVIDLGETTFEIDSWVTATVTLTAFGNESMLNDVTFYWNRSTGSNLQTDTNSPDPVTFTVTSSWYSTELGSNFEVRALYPINDTLSETWTFDIAPPRVTTWQNGPISSDTVWQLTNCPYGVNGMVSIEAGAVLTINPGCVVKFNVSSGFVVNGILIAQGTETNPITFTSYQFTKAKDDWNWIEFRDGGGSTVSHAIVEYARTGLRANSSSPLIEESIIRNIGQSGIHLLDSQSLVMNNTISNTSEGILIEDSSPLIENNMVEDSFTGIRTMDSVNVNLSNNAITQTSYGMNITQSSNVTVESSNLSGNLIRALNANIATNVRFFNSTFESNGLDVLLIASNVWLVNTSFNESSVSVTTGSKLVAANFLHLRTEYSNGTSIPNIKARVTTDGFPVFIGWTGNQGYLRWIVVADRTFNGVNTPVKNVNVVNISAQGFSVVDNDRTVDMATSRTEVFVLTPTGQTPPPPGIFSGDLWWILIVLAALITALIIAFMFFYAKRKKKKMKEKMKKRAKKKMKKKIKKGRKLKRKKIPTVIPIEKIVLNAGTMYMMDEEKPSRTYKLFKKELAGGADGLCITRTNPDKAREKHGIDCDFLWLSRNEHEDSIKPTNLGAILQRSKIFMSDADKGIVVLDGLDYLIVQNGFTQALKFMHLLNEAVSATDSKIVVSFNPQSLDEEKRALLTSDMEVIH
jgi:parallel beta-helix repeat protein